MLIYLHVKNLALIDEIEVAFGPGLNILTGETGAGKSIIIGSINLALGGKLSKEMIRNGQSQALVELVFTTNNAHALAYLASLGIEAEGGEIVITRKVTEGRSSSRINKETCQVAQIRTLAAYLLDIHGQHAHQSLLYKEQQLLLLDAFAGEDVAKEKRAVADAYAVYKTRADRLKDFEIDEESRKRELSFLAFEISEIEAAGIRDGEDEELEARYKKIAHAKHIMDHLNLAYELTGYETNDGGGNQIGRAVKEVQSACAYDDTLTGLLSSLTDIDSLLNDFNRETAQYLSDLTFEDGEFARIEMRLDLLNQLKAKYGRTLTDVMDYRKRQEERKEVLLHFEEEKEEAGRLLAAAEEGLSAASAALSKKRFNTGVLLRKRIISELSTLNFAAADFDIVFTRASGYTANGFDEVEFMISANPGEPRRPLARVASGGELSRIMLAIKTILADKDETETLIFDEIDTGISGRTAQRVAEKMAVIALHRQVLCITHLSQIAAMADMHYLIEKSVGEGGTLTRIKKLERDRSEEELARILGGARITKAVRDNAREMKELATLYKEGLK